MKLREALSWKKWEVLESTYILKTEWFKIRKDTVKIPNGTIYPDYYVKERPDWVAIYGLTDSKEVILLRTYKHGSKSLIYELPSGSIDENETSEDAVKRELSPFFSLHRRGILMPLD
jgi:NADH pyrophosphatase NudC (nudix superfamily)